MKICLVKIKVATLCRFMGLGKNKISSWEQMKQKFFRKYKDYYRFKERREEVFRMTQEEYWSVEDYFERFK